jgi:hypothetical protein
MKLICIRFFVFLVLSSYYPLLHAQAPDTLWTKVYGGAASELIWSVEQTSDDGYIIGASTRSFGFGDRDFWLLRTNAQGDTLWTRTYGGDSTERLCSALQTFDGGYFMAGCTESFGSGSSDIYVIKTDESGDTLWTRTYGDTGYDICYSALQTQDGGYILGGDINYGDIYLLKIDSVGDSLWSQVVGDSGDEDAWEVQQTFDGGYVIVGFTSSYGAGSYDIWLVRTDSLGDTLWTKTYGGASWDYGLSVDQTADGGYIIGGRTNSYGAGGSDLWLIKTNDVGDTVWTRIYGGTGADGARSVRQTSDGGYIAVGFTYSFGAGEADVYIIKTEASGDKLWTQTFGGARTELAESVQETSDGGYIIAAGTSSFGAGGSDLWIIKMEPDTFGITEQQASRTEFQNPIIQINPNPAKTFFEINSQTPVERIQIYNVTGQLIKEEIFSDYTPTQRVSLKDLNSGAYFVKCVAEDFTSTKKLILLK